jgi:hypothetical protein
MQVVEVYVIRAGAPGRAAKGMFEANEGRARAVVVNPVKGFMLDSCSDCCDTLMRQQSDRGKKTLP